MRFIERKKGKVAVEREEGGEKEEQEKEERKKEEVRGGGRFRDELRDRGKEDSV